MKGRSGTGKQKITYYYYLCKEKSYEMRVVAEKVEGAVLDRFGVLAQQDGLLDKLVAQTNARMQRQVPGVAEDPE